MASKFELGKTYIVTLDAPTGFKYEKCVLIDEVETTNRHTLTFTNGKRRYYGRVGTKMGYHMTCVLTNVDGIVYPSSVVELDDNGAEVVERKTDIYEQTCNTCGETKPIAEFFESHRTRTGYMHMCKTCYSEKLRKGHDAHKDGMKKCKSCKETKPLCEFYQNYTHKDGHRSKCKSCELEEKRINRNREKGDDET